jgi:hypothetical protein
MFRVKDHCDLLPLAAVQDLGSMKKTRSWIWRLCNTFMARQKEKKIEGSAPEWYDIELWNVNRIEHGPQFSLERNGDCNLSSAF